MRKEVRRKCRLVTFKGSNINPIADLGKLGFSPTSGFRTQKHQDALRAQGLTTTKTGSHPAGDGLDFMPPKGMKMSEAIALVKRTYPGTRVAASNKGALHITFPGWGKAPDVSGSRERYGD
jgi:hypothetical protein